MNGILKRLDTLERERLIKPITVLAKNRTTGEQKIMGVDEMISKNYDFCRAVAGSSLSDLDKILNHIAHSVIC